MSALDDLVAFADELGLLDSTVAPEVTVLEAKPGFWLAHADYLGLFLGVDFPSAQAALVAIAQRTTGTRIRADLVRAHDEWSNEAQTLGDAQALAAVIQNMTGKKATPPAPASAPPTV